MLERMFLGDPPASHDRILDFSTPVTGTLFFVPSADFLDDIPDPPAIVGEAYVGDEVRVDAASGAPPELERPAPGSLGIGDLKGGHLR
jgi:putative iron-dependent peroxidase